MDIIKLMADLDVNAVNKENFNKWYTTLQQISEKNKQKNYLGDFKWVLYQYICDMGSDSNKPINIRCGNFAFNKLAPVNIRLLESNSDHEHYLLNLNGEDVWVHHSYTLDKKQLIISTHDYSFSDCNSETDTTIYQGDVVLYFV